METIRAAVRDELFVAAGEFFRQYWTWREEDQQFPVALSAYSDAPLKYSIGPWVSGGWPTIIRQGNPVHIELIAPPVQLNYGDIESLIRGLQNLGSGKQPAREERRIGFFGILRELRVVDGIPTRRRRQWLRRLRSYGWRVSPRRCRREGLLGFLEPLLRRLGNG